MHAWLPWIAALGWIVAAFLGLLLWSGRSQRPTRIEVAKVGTPDEIADVVDALIRSPRVGGNSVRLLENGDGFFPVLLEAVEAARSSVHLEVYIWEPGAIANRLAHALADAARRGVRVRLLLDGMGAAGIERTQRTALRDAGCAVTFFHDVRLRSLGRLNSRTHRKLAVVDGLRAFVFGHGISPEWEGSGDRPGSWRDLGMEVRGPILRQLQGAFAQHWMEESGDVLEDPAEFPAPEVEGHVVLQLVASSPKGGVSSSSLYYRVMIAAARRELLIANPYFAPAAEVLGLLRAARERGVRVRLLTAGERTDSRLIWHAAHALYPALVDAGVEVWEYAPSLLHQKVVVVDRRWAYLGSANFDERSFDINAELGLGIWDEETAQALAALFESDLELAHRLQPDELSRRPLHHRAADWLCARLRGQI
ncbi:MAG: phospholipase D-like domain-containing protein [Thermoanaerobaculia bacterium]